MRRQAKRDATLDAAKILSSYYPCNMSLVTGFAAPYIVRTHLEKMKTRKHRNRYPIRSCEKIKNPPLPNPLLPRREEREKTRKAIFSQLLSDGGRGVSPSPNHHPNGMKIIQPRVARNELPWETRPEQDINSERVASNRIASNSNDDTGLIVLIRVGETAWD